MWKPAPRFAPTTLPCPHCGRSLTARRTCHEAYLRCDHCQKEFSLQQFIRQMDTALEEFLEAINCDRI